MSVEYSDLSRVCPKDTYPLINIDKLVDNSSGYKLFSFMDFFSMYNQIPLDPKDEDKTTFMVEAGNHFYVVMSFKLKNVGVTYQRMMNEVFKDEIRDMLKVCMDDMIVKYREELDHMSHLNVVFIKVRKYNMHSNLENCTFGVKAAKFMGLYLTEKGIKVNPDNFKAEVDMELPMKKKGIQ